MRFLILAVGLAFASTAAAQSPAPLQTPFASNGTVAQVAGGGGCGGCAPTVVNGSGGCAAHQVREGHKCQLFRFGGGTVNPVGCGCCASEKTFFWGGCKQFFNPQQTCGNGNGCGCGGGKGCGRGFGGGIGGCFGERCELTKYGPGIPAGGTCNGPFSYTMR
jgi:hypothetical protein